MTTAATLINDALEYLNVSSGIMGADPGQKQRTFTSLKRLFDVLPTQNIYLQMQRPATVNADLREPLWATEHLVVILARQVAAYFQAEFGFIQTEQYQEAMNQLRRKTGKPVSTSYPSTLPMGAGNRDYTGYSYFFYPGQNEYQYTLFDDAKVGEIKIYTADFSDEASRRNTTLSAVSWSNVGDEDVGISAPAVSGNISTATITIGSTAGLAVVKARGTFATGEVYDIIIKIQINDPEGVYLGGDTI